MGLMDRIQRGWNAFRNRDPTSYYKDIGSSYSIRPDRVRFTRGNERSIITSIYNRIAMNEEDVEIRHSPSDDNERYI